MVASLVTAVFAIGAIYMTPLINVMLSNLGRKGTFIYWGLAGLILIPSLAFFQPQPDKKRFDNEGKTGGKDAVVDLSKYKNTNTPNQALKTKEFYVCGILYIGGAMSGQVFVSQAAMIAGVQAPSWDGATFLVIVIAVANAIGRFFWSSLGGKVNEAGLIPRRLRRGASFPVLSKSPKTHPLPLINSMWSKSVTLL